ncbi:MAG: hypothetical protein IJX65_03150 [Alistipes sp.]|nr:hypothetical protein [Alistipes sp.]
MKKFLQLFIIVVMSCCIGISCDKEQAGGIGSMEDLVGTYSVKLEQSIVWGGDSGLASDSGTVTITNISGNRVQLSGFISTTGELVNGNLYLDSNTSSDSYGYLTTRYNSIQFGGGIITIWAKTSGQLATTPYGTRYSFSSYDYFEGRKIY